MEPEHLDLACEENIDRPTPRGASGTELKPSSDVPLDHASPKVVDMGRSDIELRIGDTVFKTHTHMLVKFAHLEGLIDRNSSSDTSTRLIRLDRDERGVEDMINTFKILYASVITEPFEFEVPVLISALRIATVYDYAALRGFAIERLEREHLGPIQRIQLAREFNLASWEEPAYDELYERDEALTDEEAQILGVVAFAKVARMREKEKLKIGKEIGKQEYKEALERGEISPVGTSEQAKEEAEKIKRRQQAANEQERRKPEEREITAEEALRKYREATTREAREQKEMQERAKEEVKLEEAVEQAEKARKEALERITKERKEKKRDIVTRRRREREERERQERLVRAEEEEGREAARQVWAQLQAERVERAMEALRKSNERRALACREG